MYRIPFRGCIFVKMKKERKYWDESFQKSLIDRMQQLREHRGYSQEEVIESTHLDISRYETGCSTPTLRSIVKLCELYGLTLAEFFAPLNYPPKK